MSRSNLFFAAVFALISAPAVAQDIYAGVGYDLARPHGGGQQSLGSVMVGAQFGQDSLTYGGELDLGFGFGVADHDTMRLRGLIRNDLGTVGLFGGLGYTQYNLDAGGSESGFNYGLGADYSLTDQTALRLEMIRDYVSDYNGSGVTTFRAGVTFGF